MDPQILVVLGILAALGIVIFFVVRKKKAIKESQQWRFGTDSRVHVLLQKTPDVTTPDGHEIFFEPGLVIAQFPAAAVDAGVDACYDRAECEYPVDRSKHREKVCVLLGESDSQGDPCFRVYIDMHNTYFNSEWDKRAGEGVNVDHYVLAAGQITRVGEPYGDVIAIPYHTQPQAAHCQNIVDYEFEHAVLAWHDGDRFEATKTHGGGMGHPILAGDCLPKARGLVARPKTVKCDGNVVLTR